MRLIPVLISGFLFASVALAGLLLPGQLLAHVKNSTSPRFDGTGDVYESALLAGVVLNQTRGTFGYVNGTLTVPYILEQPNSIVDMWVGIDPSTCPTNLQLGVAIQVDATGTTYQVPYAGSGNPNTWGFLNVDVSPGDSLQMTLNVWDQHSSSVTIDNLNNGQTDTKHIQSGTQPFCKGTLGWFVQARSTGDINLSLVNFRTVSFTDAKAGARDRGPIYGPGGGTTYLTRVGQDGQAGANILWDESSVNITYTMGY